MDTADEFYCAMGQLSAEMMEFTKEDSDKLIKVFYLKKNHQNVFLEHFLNFALNHDSKEIFF